MWVIRCMLIFNVVNPFPLESQDLIFEGHDNKMPSSALQKIKKFHSHVPLLQEGKDQLRFSYLLKIKGAEGNGMSNSALDQLAFFHDFPSIAEYYISIIASVGRTIIFQSPNRLENLGSGRNGSEMSPLSD